jgi:hypothetical protein
VRHKYTLFGLSFCACCLIACTNTGFTPLWYGPLPNTAHHLKKEKDIIVSAGFSDIDNGQGVQVSGLYSPIKHVSIGLGLGSMRNKGKLTITDETIGLSQLLQFEVMGGTYWNFARDFISLQCYSGFGYASSKSKLFGAQQLSMGYQKMFLQPAVMIRLPNQMSLDISYRLSQLIYTGASVNVGNVPTSTVFTLQDLELNSPFRVQEFGAGYSASYGPMQMGLQFTVAANFKSSMATQFNMQGIHTTLRFNITDMLKNKKKLKPEVQGTN